MFESLVEIVVDGGHGVRAYNSCAKAARARISSEPDNAAALTLIMFAAQGVVEAYDDQPLPVERKLGAIKTRARKEDKFGKQLKAAEAPDVYVIVVAWAKKDDDA